MKPVDVKSVTVNALHCPEPCQEWTGAKLKSGYGVIRRNHKTTTAHRYFWEEAHGPVPKGLIVGHVCDNPGCVNLNHLYLGTQHDNMRDCAWKGRLWMQKHPEMLRGEQNGRCKLTEFRVKMIREEYRNRKQVGGSRGLARGSQHWLSKVFGISRSVIKDIIQGKTWTWVS